MIMVNFEDEKKNSKTLMNNFFCCMQRDIFKLHIIPTSSKEKGIKKEWNQDD